MSVELPPPHHVFDSEAMAHAHDAVQQLPDDALDYLALAVQEERAHRGLSPSRFDGSSETVGEPNLADARRQTARAYAEHETSVPTTLTPFSGLQAQSAPSGGHRDLRDIAREFRVEAIATFNGIAPQWLQRIGSSIAASGRALVDFSRSGAALRHGYQLAQNRRWGQIGREMLETAIVEPFNHAVEAGGRYLQARRDEITDPTHGWWEPAQAVVRVVAGRSARTQLATALSLNPRTPRADRRQAWSNYFHRAIPAAKRLAHAVVD